jgi:ABC-type transporter Mla subunit MlaD
MQISTTYWKLGLFLVVVCACVVLGLGLFGSHAIGQKTVDYATYVDESVGGLGDGSPVRFRGLTIGRVKRIDLAPDRRHVEITCALGVARLHHLGLTADGGSALALQPDMRAQLAQPGLTGPQVLAIDYFDPATHPPPELPFPVSTRTIPSTPSSFAGLGDSLAVAVGQLPELIGRASRLFGAVSEMATRLDDAGFGERTDEALRSANEVLVLMRDELAKLGTERVPEQLGRAVGTLDSALSQLDRLISHLDGEQGLVTSAQRASDAVGEAARGSHDLARQLDATLRDVRRTAETVRRLADALDRDPDIFLKGRPKGAQ